MNKRIPATGSERQAKYRASKGLGGVFLVEATRTAINALQLRMGLPKGAVVARAIDLLTKELDRKELRRKRPAGEANSAGTAGTAETNAVSSLSNDYAPHAISRSAAARSQPTATAADAKVRRRLTKSATHGDSPDLFDGLIPYK